MNKHYPFDGTATEFLDVLGAIRIDYPGSGTWPLRFTGSLGGLSTCTLKNVIADELNYEIVVTP